ncbi:DUF4256 domain-containing protein [Rurimicrobium arvi]
MAVRLSKSTQQQLLSILEQRFRKHPARHPQVSWEQVELRLQQHPKALETLQRMEESGGEPDLISYDKHSGVCSFFDCAAESPKGRRSLCYDNEALDARKEAKPAGSALALAQEIGIRILTEEDYRYLQQLQPVDLKTSSWIYTPEAIRKLDGALFCDRRYDHVFVYHNGASSYYAARGFRGRLDV